MSAITLPTTPIPVDSLQIPSRVSSKETGELILESNRLDREYARIHGLREPSLEETTQQIRSEFSQAAREGAWIGVKYLGNSIGRGVQSILGIGTIRTPLHSGGPIDIIPMTQEEKELMQRSGGATFIDIGVNLLPYAGAS
jgi:hypothetical protein